MIKVILLLLLHKWASNFHSLCWSETRTPIPCPVESLPFEIVTTKIPCQSSFIPHTKGRGSKIDNPISLYAIPIDFGIIWKGTSWATIISLNISFPNKFFMMKNEFLQNRVTTLLHWHNDIYLCSVVGVFGTNHNFLHNLAVHTSQDRSIYGYDVVSLLFLPSCRYINVDVASGDLKVRGVAKFPCALGLNDITCD